MAQKISFSIFIFNFFNYPFPGLAMKGGLGCWGCLFLSHPAEWRKAHTKGIENFPIYFL